MNPQLLTFIAHARERGMDHATIRMLLLSAGWKEKDIAQALTEQALDVEIPHPPDRGGAREAFQHLLAFSALYCWTLALVFLLLGFLDHHLPDPADAVVSDRLVWSGVRWRLALLLVAFPAFLWFTRSAMREIRASPERARSPIRRWLTYLTLLFAALALGGDLVMLVFRLLEGELTARFLAKAAVVLVVAGGVFAYYLAAIGDDLGRARWPRLHRTFGLAATALVAGAWIWGLVLVGSPAAERERRLDDRRIEDLRNIRTEIASQCVERSPDGATLKRPLPGSLEELVAEPRTVRPDVHDPKSGEPYVYERLDDHRYRLCATFENARHEPHDPFWDHDAGPHCFDIDALE